MDPANDEPKAVEGVIVPNGDGEGATLAVDIPAEEQGPESDTVRVAEIEAETAVAITAINADVEQARIEANAERDEQCHERDLRIAALQASMTERDQEITSLREQLSQAQASLSTPTLETLAETAAETETVVELNLTPQSTPELTSETLTELGAEGEAESVEAVEEVLAVPARKRRRLI